MGIKWQLFSIGFSFGIAGPCLLTCTPILIVYTAGKQTKWIKSLSDIFIFLIARLLAYLVLGYLAGLSAVALRRLANSQTIFFLKMIGGMIIILLGIYLLSGKELAWRLCKYRRNTIFNYGSLFSLGFIIGISPCAPLLALLFEITLISKSALEGLSYALFFGLGTLISGLIVIGAICGIFSWLPIKILKSKKVSLVFRIICALILIWLGLNLIFRFYPYDIYKIGVVG